MTEYLSVSLLTKYLKAKFDRDPYLERVYLTGEISNFREGRYYYQYFSIKDENDDKVTISAQIKSTDYKRLQFKFENSLKVLVVGRISMDSRRAQATLTIEKITPDGIGELTLKLEELKKKLTAEGLFDERFKQEIPSFAKRIGVITASSGAVIHDIINTVNDRFPLTDVVLFPSKVSGTGSVDELVRNIRMINERDDIDIIIIGRGGGSIEDLWSFNEEAVVRAIFESKIPVISSVGHETDTTLADFVADKRAATPTQAAMFATANTKADLLNWLLNQNARLSNLTKQKIDNHRNTVTKLTQSVIFRQPERLYDGYLQKLSNLTEQMVRVTERKIQENHHRYEILQGKLEPSFSKIVENRKNRLEKSYQALLLLDISKIKARGFALVKSDEKLIKSAKTLKSGQIVELEFDDGSNFAKIIEKGEI